MVMPVIPFEKSLADGAATKGGRRPCVVASPSAASPELSDRPHRRTFTAAYKLGILRQVDEAGPGGIGAILRREGLYSSLLTDWRRHRDAGACEALKAVKRGPKVAEPNPLAAEHAQLQRDNKSLTLRLQRAEAIVEIQKTYGPPRLQGVFSRSAADRSASTYPASEVFSRPRWRYARSGPHKSLGVERRFLNQASGAPFDCQAISSSPSRKHR